MAARREQRDLGGPEKRARRHHHVAFGHVVAAPPDRVLPWRGPADRHARGAGVGPLDRHDGVGARGQQRPRHDLGAGAGGDRESPGVAGRDLVGHRQDDRRVRRRRRHVGRVDRVTVHRGVVERGQRAQGGGVFGKDPTLRLLERQPDGGQQLGRREDVGEVCLDRHQVGGHPRLSRYLRSQGTNSAATSGLSHANWVMVRR